MSNNNNSTDIIVKGPILQERDEEDYPDPSRTILIVLEKRAFKILRYWKTNYIHKKKAITKLMIIRGELAALW